MMELKIMQIYELAAIAARDVLGFLEFSIAGKAPVDSPTSIISTDRSGKILRSSKLFESVCPSRTRPAAIAILFRICRLPIDAPAVSSDGTRGKPPVSRVESMREKFAT